MNENAGKPFWLLFVTLHTRECESRIVGFWNRWDVTAWQSAPFEKALMAISSV